MSGFRLDIQAVAKRQAAEANAGPIDPVAEFTDLLVDNGFDLTHVQTTGEKVVRVDSRDGKKNNKHCWYVFHIDSHGVGYGAYGDWRYGDDAHTYRSGNYTMLDPEARRRSEEEARKREVLRKAKVEADQKTAAQVAAQRLSKMQDCAPDYKHPYLERKNVQALGLKTDGKNLYVPVYCEGALTSYQCILPEKKVDEFGKAGGDKFFLTDGRIEGGYHFIQGRIAKTYFVEGYATGATINQVTGANVVVCFNAHNLEKVIRTYRQTYNDPIVIAADNDHVSEQKGKKNAGLVAAEKCAKEFPNVTYVYPEGITGSDFNDLAAEQGIDAVKKRLGIAASRVEIAQIDQMPVTSTRWMVKGVIPHKRIGCFFGPSGEMKSFATIDLCLHIATGRDWHGHKTKAQHDVLYVCGEGFDGIRNRVVAWKQHHEITQPIPMYMTKSPVLFLEKDHVSAMVQSLQDFMVDNRIDNYPSLIVIDTLNRNFGGGDENATQDMTKFISALDEVSNLTGSMFLVVHHSNKSDSSRARGNASLYNASDFEYRIHMTNRDEVRELEETPIISMECTKMKDSSEPAPMFFSPTVVDLYADEDGDMVSSVVLNKMDAPKKSPEQVNAAQCKSILKQPLEAAANNSEKAKLLLRDALIACGRGMARRSGKPLGICPFINEAEVQDYYRRKCKLADIGESTVRVGKKRAVDEFAQLQMVRHQSAGDNKGYIITSAEMVALMNSEAGHE